MYTHINKRMTHTHATHTHRAESTPAYQQLVHSQQMQAALAVQATILNASNQASHEDICMSEETDSKGHHGGACSCGTPANVRMMDKDSILQAVRTDDYNTIRCVFFVFFDYVLI
jgi:hypothetical protein